MQGIAACLPTRTLANDEKIAQATGIRSRRVVSEGTTVLDLCVKAAERVLSDTGVSPKEIGAVIGVSFTQTERMPALAIQAQARLGLPREIVAFDVMMACSGWGYGLYLAADLVRTTGRHVLLLDGDVQSSHARDESTAPLLSDGGSATLLGPSSKDASWMFHFSCDGAKGAALRLQDGGAIEMDGFGVFRFVATDVATELREFLKQQAKGEFTFVPHQPNAYMVRQLAKEVGVSDTHTALSCDELGNLSSASIPVTIAWKGVRGPIVFAGFGGGLSIALGALTLNQDCRFAVVEI